MKEESLQKIPLKTILKNFLNHVENIETKRIEGEDPYEREFQRLKGFSDELKTKEEFACSEGDKDVNKKKNRYKDILPFDGSRVILSDYPGVPGSDYINANFIKGASGSNAYIACQGPLPHTVNDFWRMVVECEVQVIVMACNEQEAGKHKCECYWSDSEEKKQFGKFFISLLKSRNICPDFLVRTIKLEWTNDQAKEEVRTVCQFHYSAWPDHGIPTQVKPLLEMVRLIRDCQASETLPLLIHCSAGCGRTGTICAIDYVFGLLRSGKITSDFSLYNLVREMRRQRIAMVQTVDQYMLCHRAVRELFLEQLRVIDSHPYENIGDDGQPLIDQGGDTVIPDYETIFVKGDVDIDKILTQRQSVPRTVMGTAMLTRDRSPPTVAGDVDGSNSGSDEPVLPATLDDFSAPPGSPHIHEPPKPPVNPKETAPQRFKKGNLRLMQTDDGGWKLEELEEKRRSLEANSPKNTSYETEDRRTSPGQKPPAADKRRKKGSKSTEENGHKDSQLLRRPSMKKIKAFFDKSRPECKEESGREEEREEGKEEKENMRADHENQDIHISSAMAKLPTMENGQVNLDDLPQTGSKSVPNSLDRKSSGLQKYWPLQNKQNQPKAEFEKPELPLKRSKSMKTTIKPVSVIPIIRSDETSFSEYRFEPGSPGYDTYPKSKRNNDEMIDLRRNQEDLQLSCTGKEFHFGERDSAPAKPKRDWSSLSQEYTTEDNKEHFDPESVKNQLREFISSRELLATPKLSAHQLTASSPQLTSLHRRQSSQDSVGSHRRQSSFEKETNRRQGSQEGIHRRQGSQEGISYSTPDHRKQGSQEGISYSTPDHRRQGSQEGVSYSTPDHRRQGSQEKDGFLELQMAKLMARKGMDEIDSGMVRSKSGDIPRIDTPNLHRSVSGDLNSRGSVPMLLDDDTRQMLRDCQEYLQGALEEGTEQYNKIGAGNQMYSDNGELGNRCLSAEHSPISGKPSSGRSVHSSPGNSYNKYLARSTSSNLGTSPGRALTGASSPVTAYHSSQNSSPGNKMSPSSKPLSRHSSGHPEDKEDGRVGQGEPPQYENVENRGQYCQVTVDAREKVSAAVKMRNRERRNSFRQAVDRVDKHGRPYEPIWFGDERDESEESPRLEDNTPDTRTRGIDTRLLSNGPVYANAKFKPKEDKDLEKPETRQTNIRSGSYDNIRLPDTGYGNIPFSTPDDDYSCVRFGAEAEDGYGAHRLLVEGGGEAGYEPVNFHQSGGGSAGSSKKNSIDKNRSQDGQTGLSSSLLVAEACRDYERGSSQPPGPQHQEQQQKKPVLQKQNSGSGGVRLPPPYHAPPGAYQPPPQGGYQGQKAYIGQSGGSGGHAHQQQPNPTSSTSPNQEVSERTPRRHGPHISTPTRYIQRPPFNKDTPFNNPTFKHQSYSASAIRTPAPPSSAASLSASIPDVRPPTESAHLSNHNFQNAAVTRRNPRETIRGVRDDSELPNRTRDEHSHVRHMKRNSSLVTMARLGLAAGQPDFIPQPGLFLKGDGTRSGPSLIVQGSRTAVHVGGGPVGPPGRPGTTPPGRTAGINPPGVDIDRVAAMLNTNDKEGPALAQMAALQGRTFGRSLAGVLSGAAANLKSRLVGIQGISDTRVRASPSPPLRGEEQDSEGRDSSAGSRVPATLPGQEFGFPVRIKSKPLGPRETPPTFLKKQEYL